MYSNLRLLVEQKPEILDELEKLKEHHPEFFPSGEELTSGHNSLGDGLEAFVRCLPHELRRKIEKSDLPANVLIGALDQRLGSILSAVQAIPTVDMGPVLEGIQQLHAKEVPTSDNSAVLDALAKVPEQVAKAIADGPVKGIADALNQVPARVAESLAEGRDQEILLRGNVDSVSELLGRLVPEDDELLGAVRFACRSMIGWFSNDLTYEIGKCRRGKENGTPLNDFERNRIRRLLGRVEEVWELFNDEAKDRLGRLTDELQGFIEEPRATTPTISGQGRENASVSEPRAASPGSVEEPDEEVSPPVIATGTTKQERGQGGRTRRGNDYEHEEEDDSQPRGRQSRSRRGMGELDRIAGQYDDPESLDQLESEFGPQSGNTEAISSEGEES